jgi:putative acetyltransferase
MRVEIDDPARPDVFALLEEHLRNMHELSPPESVHALDVSQLQRPEVTFWSVRDDDGTLLGCGALQELDPGHGEVKSMRTPQSARRKGAGRAVLAHIVEVARQRGYARLSLETGSMEAFKPAWRLYESFGFQYCGPFAGYTLDPYSVFMTLELRYVIEAARAADAAEFVRIRGLTRENAVSAERLAALGITVETWAADIVSGVLIGYVARRGDEIDGYCFGDTRTGELVVLALLPDAEGHGVGRTLLERVVQALADAGHRRLFLGCSKDPKVRSHGFYRHLGWRPTGQVDGNDDEILELLAPEHVASQ